MRYSKKKEMTREQEHFMAKVRKAQPLLTFFLVLITIICLLPMVLVIIVSFSSKASIDLNGFTFFPTEWSLDGYRYVWTFRERFLSGYMVTIYETVVGTAVAMFISAMFAYGLSRRNFMLNKYVTYLLIASMLISGGSVSTFIVYSNVYGLRNNLLVLILVGLVNVFQITVMRTFIWSTVPDSLIEAAKIDGAGDWRIFIQIVFPLMKPVLGALGFMEAVGHWNQWNTSLLYIDNPNYASLQMILMKIEKNIDYLKQQMAMGTITAEEMDMLKNIPEDAARMAMMLCVAGPILFVYPFFQKYFVKGMTVGAVKG